MFRLFFALPAAHAAFTFLTVGDWGGEALQEPTKPYKQNVLDVAKAMDSAAKASSAKFIVNTGDNFYWCGIQNVSDFQIKTDWLDPFYSKASLQVPWYGVLGNHEYGYNVSAQIDLHKKYDAWVMDDHHYTRRIQLDSSHYASFIFLDTSPCISEYRATDPAGWDPCSSRFPTCSLSGGTDIFEGPCHFHDNIMSVDCKTQLTWLQKALSSVDKADWLIIVGHHAAAEIDVEDLTGAFQSHGFDLYLNGHEHALTHYTVDGTGAYVTSGAGALVIPSEEIRDTALQNRTYNKMHGLDLENMATTPYGLGHTYQPVFHDVISGFTRHTFSTDFASLTTDFLNTDGHVVHSFTVQKRK